MVTASVMAQHGPPAAPAAPPETAREAHLSNVKQLTFGGENAEAYFSFDGQELSFQSTRDGGDFDEVVLLVEGRPHRLEQVRHLRDRLS